MPPISRPEPLIACRATGVEYIHPWNYSGRLRLPGTACRWPGSVYTRPDRQPGSEQVGKSLADQARRRPTNAGFEQGAFLQGSAYVTSGTEHPPARAPSRVLAKASLSLAAVMLAGCGPSPQDAEEEIAALVETASEAVRQGDFAGLHELLSDDYEDAEGRDNRAMRFLVRSWLGRYPGIFVVVTDLQVRPISRELATANMVVNVLARESGRPLPVGLDADRLPLRLALRREGDEWRVTRADWGRNGSPADGTTN